MRVFHDLKPALHGGAYQQTIAAIGETIEVQASRQRDPGNEYDDTCHERREQKHRAFPRQPCQQANDQPNKRIPHRRAPAVTCRPIAGQPDWEYRHQTERDAQTPHVNSYSLSLTPASLNVAISRKIRVEASIR